MGTGEGAAFGRLTVDPTLEKPDDHYVLNDQGQQVAIPAEAARQAFRREYPDVDLNNAQGDLRAVFSHTGELEALVPANRLPPGRVMVEWGGAESNRWEPVEWNETVIGPISVDPTLEDRRRHYIHTAQNGTRYALPAEAARQEVRRGRSDVDLNHAQGDFEATISPEAGLTALVSFGLDRDERAWLERQTSRIREQVESTGPRHQWNVLGQLRGAAETSAREQAVHPRQVMMERGGWESNQWEPVTWNDAVTGLITVGHLYKLPIFS